MTLEYSDTLTATFTCTAFGGDGAVLDFSWSPTDSPSGLNVPSEAENVNADNSTTSSITTNPLGLGDRGSRVTCDVMYEGETDISEDFGTLNIGKISIITQLNFLLCSILVTLLQCNTIYNVFFVMA